MPLGPPGDREAFDTFDECVRTLLRDDDDLEREEAEAICGKWEQAVNVVQPRANAVDPTRTKSMRARFAAEARRRVREMARVVEEAVGENDVFGLGMDPPRGAALAANAQPPFGPTQAPPPAAFAYPRDPEKVEAFMEWLRRQVAAGFLVRTINPAGGMSNVTSDWANTYIRRASRKGVAHADLELRKAGANVDTADLDAIFRSPRHANTLGLAYTRTFNELRGITDAMDQQVSRALANGLAQGWNPTKMGREMGGTIRGLGTERATLIASTESVRAFNENALDRYENFGVGRVAGQAEVLTAGDSKVCEQCAALEGRTFVLEDARGVIPLHPRCRCTWLPVV